MRTLRDILPSIVVETCAGNAPVKLGSLSGPRSHPQGQALPIKIADERRATPDRTPVRTDEAPAHTVRSRVWTGGPACEGKGAPQFLLNVPARKRRGFSHFIYKQGGKRVPIYR